MTIRRDIYDGDVGLCASIMLHAQPHLFMATTPGATLEYNTGNGHLPAAAYAGLGLAGTA